MEGILGECQDLKSAGMGKSLVSEPPLKNPQGDLEGDLLPPGGPKTAYFLQH